MLAKPETWVLVAFLLFIALLIYLKVPAKVAQMLDERSARIAKELAEAKKLREEAQALLEEYKRKRAQAEKDAEDIVALARKEAEALAHETRAKLAETLERRTRQAEQKIAQAEQQAVKDVRTAATDVAVNAASELLAAASAGAKGAQLIEESIAAVKSRLN
ncbi:MAG: ATP F0F1 synthase subunit B [Pseudomonadota bacterium]